MKATRWTVLSVFLLLITSVALAQRGKEGTVIAPAGSTIVNTYTYLTANATAGTNTLTVNSNVMTGGAFGAVPLAPGDLIMVIQMQGVTVDINTTPTVVWGGNYTVPNDYFVTWGANPQQFGQILNYNQSGLHERIEVRSVSGGNTITTNCNLINSYTSSGHVQVIRIPRYQDLTVNVGSTISATAWNGQIGGVVALEVDGTLTNNGTISSSSLGFRAGQLDPNSLTGTGGPNIDRHLGSFDNLEGSEKGEGIAGFTTEYIALFSRYGKGAIANGGGGGGYQNTGGGGGSNVSVGGTYTGKGNPQGFAAVWNLEAPGFGGSTSPGGGRGGYAYASSDQNELVVGPDNALWSGDHRMENGGFGGHPLLFVADRVWMGGGGGAGDQDSGEGGAGGRGGGLVFMNTYGPIVGSGTIAAFGENGQNSNPTGAAPTGGNPIRGEDGAGGGGAGGSIHVVNVSAFPATMLLDVHGGNGGNQDIDNLAMVPDLEAGGPGGSGSGGYIRITSGAPIKNLSAGAQGTTESTFMVNFPPNGATAGSNGFNPLPANPAFNLTLNNTTICAGATANLTAVQFGAAAGTVTWYNAMVGGAVITTGLNYVTPPLFATTTYWVGVCPGSFREPVTVTVNPIDNASFNYSAASYCVSDPNQAATITGLAGGTFTIAPAVGLPINAGTGMISVNGATPGVYTVTYTTAGPCPNSSNVGVTITALDNASFNYSAASYCTNDPNQAATITGQAGGTFTIAPAAGLPINAGTGFLSVNGATPGVYTVTYTTPAPCSNSSNVMVTITALDNAGFNYSAASYCSADPNQAATITGQAGGSFSILPAAGLPINAGTGLLSVTGATPGVYTITYTTPAPCSNSSNVVVTITAIDNAGFNYSAAAYCVNAPNQAATITGEAGGTFTIAPAVGLPINAGTGLLSVTGATPGVYTVTYTTSAPCSNSSNVVVTINAMDNAGFNYSAAAYCVNDVNQSATITGLAGGNFTIAPAVGLPINAGTGFLSVNGATPGAYTVTYTTAGSCPNSSNVVVTINAMDNASFNYSAAAYCVNDVDQSATITGLAGGSFTIAPAVGLPINAGTGFLSVNGATPGAYTVTYTTAGTCPNSSNVAVTINALDNASFNYSAAAYCTNAVDQSATITGLAGGTFSIAPAVGLPINAGTGFLSVNGATPGVYTVTYTTAGTCPNSSNVVVTINAMDNASFNYSAASYCAADADQSATITGLAGGTFTIAPAVGLPINAGTGFLSVNGATPGAYTVTYTTAGTCPNSSNVAVTIDPPDNAGFNYAAASYCVSGADPSPTITGLAGGGFTAAPVGITINAATGQIDVSASIPGAYTVTYTTTGTCPNSSNFAVAITALDDASFNYSAGAYCQNGTNPTPTITGVAGGTFSSLPAGMAINAATGQIDVNASTPGIYAVSYTTVGACANSSSVPVTINAMDDPTFSYASANYCIDGSDPAPTITGLAGGTFTSFPAGFVVLNSTTGLIDVSATIPGTYTITYTTSGICPNFLDQVVTINALDDAGFSYSSPTYCEGASNPTATITGITGGTFTSAPAGLTLNAATGGIDLNTSTPGIYSVTYTTAGSCPNSSNQAVTIFGLPVAPVVSADMVYCVGDVLNDMTATGGPGTFTWYDDFGLTNVIGTGGTQTPYAITGVTTYYVTETENGCEGPESSIVITIEDCDILIPTAFTPDGDGANDDWELQNIDNIYPNNVVKVYNRWGNLLFESPQGSYDSNRWDGTYKGSLLPVASYYFIIEPNADGVDTKTGSVSIILNN